MSRRSRELQQQINAKNEEIARLKRYIDSLHARFAYLGDNMDPETIPEDARGSDIGALRAALQVQIEQTRERQGWYTELYTAVKRLRNTVLPDRRHKPEVLNDINDITTAIRTMKEIIR